MVRVYHMEALRSVQLLTTSRASGYVGELATG
jgi:hypothetical protein